jgi:pentatricopeptide repeat protein
MKMREKRMRINVITYNAAINALAKGSRLSSKRSPKGALSKEEGNPGVGLLWMRALELLQQMKKDGIEPDGYSYSAAISACGSCGRWKEALDLIQIMQKGGPRNRPNKIAYTAAIGTCIMTHESSHARHSIVILCLTILCVCLVICNK